MIPVFPDLKAFRAMADRVPPGEMPGDTPPGEGRAAARMASFGDLVGQEENETQGAGGGPEDAPVPAAPREGGRRAMHALPIPLRAAPEAQGSGIAARDFPKTMERDVRAAVKAPATAPADAGPALASFVQPEDAAAVAPVPAKPLPVAGDGPGERRAAPVPDTPPRMTGERPAAPAAPAAPPPAPMPRASAGTGDADPGNASVRAAASTPDSGTGDAARERRIPRDLALPTPSPDGAPGDSTGGGASETARPAEAGPVSAEPPRGRGDHPAEGGALAPRAEGTAPVPPAEKGAPAPRAEDAAPVPPSEGDAPAPRAEAPAPSAGEAVIAPVHPAGDAAPVSGEEAPRPVPPPVATDAVPLPPAAPDSPRAGEGPGRIVRDGVRAGVEGPSRPVPASPDGYRAGPRGETPAPRTVRRENDPYSIAAPVTGDPLAMEDAAQMLAATAPATAPAFQTAAPATPMQPAAMGLATPVAVPVPEASPQKAPGDFADEAGDMRTGLVSRGSEGGMEARQAAAPQRPVTADGADALREIVRAAVVAKGPTTIELRLDPSELGRIDIELNFADDRVSVMVRGEREDALDLMRRSSDDLGRMLRQAGLDLDTLGFSRDQAGGRDRERAARGLSIEMPGEAGEAVQAHAGPGTPRDRIDIRI